MKNIRTLISILLLVPLVGCKVNENNDFSTASASITINSNGNGGIITPDKVNITETFNTIEDKRQFNTQTLPSTGDVNLLVIPVIIPGFETIDIDGDGNDDRDKVADDIKEAFFGEGKDNHESLSSYYKKSSYGKLNLSGTVTDWYFPSDDPELGITSPNDITITKTYDIVKAAVEWAQNEQGIDTANFDSDEDGYVDGVWLVYSAPDYAHGGPNTDDKNYWAYTSWGNQSGSTAQKPNKNNPVYNLFGWASYDFMYEGYGNDQVDAHTFIHETGHFLGLADYYSDDIKYSPVGKVDMMDGNIIDQNSYSKMLLGWTKPYIALGNGTIDISSMENENSFIVIPKDGTVLEDNNFDPFSEYILVELYSNEGLNYIDSVEKLSDRPLAMTTKGVRIYHINNTKYLLSKSDFKYTVKVYEGEKIDSSHRIILPISNALGQDTYNANFNFPIEYNLFDEIRLIEVGKKDTFSYGGFQTDKSLFKSGMTFSISDYKDFFINGDKLDDGSAFTSSVTIGDIK